MEKHFSKTPFRFRMVYANILSNKIHCVNEKIPLKNKFDENFYFIRITLQVNEASLGVSI